MATASQTCDVFISHAASDTAAAHEVAGSLEAVGLRTFHAGSLLAGEDVSEVIWQALAESRALIVVVSADVSSLASVMLEIGAARAWNKPIFVVLKGPSSTRLPGVLQAYPVFPLGRIDDVIQQIRAGFQPLSELEQATLARVYGQVGVTLDRLVLAPIALQELVTKFGDETGRQLTGELLLAELLRMRKRSQLPRLTQSGSADRS
ncbi:MAG: toll/interleukin-1 receptor domain-containing protein [Pirellulaceae bacterium]|nr:toll/interleukin-1 receptor domain-containing protein [Pirellulaceae bacterium]